MKGGALGFSRKEIIFFTVILVSSLVIMTFCLFRVVKKFYTHSGENGARIRQLSAEVLRLQEMSMTSVSIQRSSLNLIIYAADRAEMKNINSLIDRNKTTLEKQLSDVVQRQVMPFDTCQKIAKTGLEYLLKNETFRKMLTDSLHAKEAADFNVSQMRPALRKLSDMITKSISALTTEVMNITNSTISIFALWESWLMLLISLPYLYFFYRFLRLFVKVMFLDTKI